MKKLTILEDNIKNQEDLKNENNLKNKDNRRLMSGFTYSQVFTYSFAVFLILRQAHLLKRVIANYPEVSK